MNAKRVMIFLAVFFLWGAAGPDHLRAEDDLGIVLKNGIYGGLIGTLVGGAVLLLINDSEDHIEFLGYGAGTGILFGTVYGITQLPRRSMVELEQGKLSWNFPALLFTREAFPFVSPRPNGKLGRKVEIGIVKVSF